MLTFNKQDELEMFGRLAREPRFKDWLAYKLSVEHEILTNHTDNDQLRKAQGRAQLLQIMSELIAVTR